MEFLALGVPLSGLIGDPIFGLLAIGPFAQPSTPWVALLGSSLADLGWLLAGAALGVGHFNALELHSRLSTFAAALAFFAIGTVLANADAFAK